MIRSISLTVVYFSGSFAGRFCKPIDGFGGFACPTNTGPAIDAF
jgi:hypothetical protein